VLREAIRIGSAGRTNEAYGKGTNYMDSKLAGDDRYLIKGDPIDSGGQGTIYLAEDRLDGDCLVAIKVLNSETCSEMTFLRGLLVDEAKLQAVLSSEKNPHPNIVCIRDLRTFNDEPAIVMEYIEGQSLHDLMGPRKQRRPLASSTFFDVAEQVCEGLDFAHKLGIIHRDVKPRNVLIRRCDCVVKIIDWGVAKNIDIAGRGKTYAGTPPYMSPEVVLLNRRNNAKERLRSLGVDHRTDVYSLGVTMYEMLTAELPFPNPLTRDDDILAGITGTQTDRLRRKGIAANLVEIVERSMAREPDQRFTSAKELQSALLACHSVSAPSGTFGSDRQDLPHSPRVTTARKQDLLEAMAPAHLDPPDYAETERRFHALVASHSSDPEVYLSFARYYIDRTQEAKGIAILAKGTQAVPQCPSLWVMRGDLHDSRGDRAAAICDLEQALNLGLEDRTAKTVRATLARLKAV
jgi:serine/threonine protein kinase